MTFSIFFFGTFMLGVTILKVMEHIDRPIDLVHEQPPLIPHHVWWTNVQNSLDQMRYPDEKFELDVNGYRAGRQNPPPRMSGGRGELDPMMTYVVTNDGQTYKIKNEDMPKYTASYCTKEDARKALTDK